MTPHIPRNQLPRSPEDPPPRVTLTFQRAVVPEEVETTVVSPSWTLTKSPRTPTSEAGADVASTSNETPIENDAADTNKSKSRRAKIKILRSRIKKYKHVIRDKNDEIEQYKDMLVTSEVKRNGCQAGFEMKTAEVAQLRKFLRNAQNDLDNEREGREGDMRRYKGLLQVEKEKFEKWKQEYAVNVQNSHDMQKQIDNFIEEMKKVRKTYDTTIAGLQAENIKLRTVCGLLKPAMPTSQQQLLNDEDSQPSSSKKRKSLP